MATVITYRSNQGIHLPLVVATILSAAGVASITDTKIGETSYRFEHTDPVVLADFLVAEFGFTLAQVNDSEMQKITGIVDV